MNALNDRLSVHIPRLEGWCTIPKAHRLAAAICELRPERSVELGVFGGRGLIALAMAHQAIGTGFAWGFDPWTVQAAVEGVNDEANNEWWSKLDMEKIYKDFVDAVRSHELLAHCYWARLKSDRAVTIFDDNSIGLIHADSNHSEQVSCDEVIRWKDKVMPGGYWFADDTSWDTMQKSQQLLVEVGFEKIEVHENWAVYRKK